MLKKLHLTVIVALTFISASFAQSSSLQGVVVDADTGEPLAGVTVSVKDEARGTSTNGLGLYTLDNVSVGDVIIFSFIGYETQEVIFEGQSSIDIELESDVALLDEVVVTAYGSQQKKAITGAVSTVNKELIEARPITTFQTALQGAAAGVSVANTTGQPGAGASIQIRGAGSLTASNEPLYVVDGVPVVNLSASGVAVQNVLNTLNPGDIESISVLKDASASSLYGSRAANGVVLITTKRGQSGPARVNVRLQRGFNDLAVETHETLNAEQYFKVYWQDYYNQNVAAGQTEAAAAQAANTSTIQLFTGGNAVPVNPFNTDQPFGPGGNLNDGAALLYDTDWIDRTVNSGANTEFDVNVSGGNRSTQYYFSANIFEQEGLLPFSDFSRGSFRMNIDTEVNDWLNVSFQSNNVVTEQNNQSTGGAGANPFRMANLSSNVYPFYERDANNQIVVDPITGRRQYFFDSPVLLDFHPIGIPELDRRLNENMRSTNNANFLANITDEISVSSNLSFDVINSKDNFFWNRRHGDAEPVGGRSGQSYNRYTTLNISNQLRYNKALDNHTIDLLLGQEYFSRHDEFMNAQRVGFATDLLTEVSAGTTITGAGSSFNDRRIISYFSRLNYGFKEKYFLTASLRRDGASEFGRDRKFGTFGSIGASWIVSEEGFLQDIESLNTLKFRASYGTTGNNSIGPYAALGLLGFASAYDYNGIPGSTYEQLANPDLQWEVITTTDLGVEFEMFDNRLTGEVVYYQRTSTDLLFDQPIPVSSAGFSSITTNLAEMKNWGTEVALNYRLVNTKDMIWSVYGNLTTVNNEITDLPVDFVQSGTKRFEVGRDRYEFYIQEWAGVDPANGDPLWFRDVLDANGDPTGERTTTNNYSQADRYYVGSSLQDMFGGFGTSLNYKGFDVNVLFTFAVGGKIYDGTRADITHLGSDPGQQLSTEVLDAWTPDNTETNVPRFGINNTLNFSNTSSRFLFDGDYMRLRNLTLGYSFNREQLSKFNVRNLRVFVVGENLLTFAAYEGLDPELPRSGLSNNIFPQSRTLTFGINIGF